MYRNAEYLIKYKSRYAHEDEVKAYKNILFNARKLECNQR